MANSLVGRQTPVTNYVNCHKGQVMKLCRRTSDGENISRLQVLHVSVAIKFG